MKTRRIRRTAAVSLLFDASYAVYCAGIGISVRSWWFITLSVYNAVLAVTRLALLRMRKKSAQFAMRFTGGMLIAASVMLLGTVILAALKDRGTVHHEIVMITIALYTFVKITLAIIKLIKAGKDGSPLVRTLRNVSLADATVSMASLQRSMLVSFEGMTAESIRVMNVLTGTGVCVFVFLLGLNLCGGRRVDMAKSKLVKANEKIADAVVAGYKKVEDVVVGGYTKIEDKFVDAYLTRDGETVEEAKERLKKGE